MAYKQFDRHKEREMRRAFARQVKEILSSVDRFYKPERLCGQVNSLKIGFESEVAIHKSGVAPHDVEKMRDVIIGEVSSDVDVELGAAQIEFRTPPVIILSLDEFRKLERVYRQTFDMVLRASQNHGASILRCGTNPFLPVMGTPRTDKPKYRLVPDFYNANRPETVDTIIGLGKKRIDIGDAAVVSLFNSFQVNVEASSLEDACDKMNRSFFIAPYLLALSGNARYLECFDTGMEDLRLMGWERSHDTGMNDLRLLAWERAFDTRTPHEVKAGRGLRVGLPERYFADIADYFSRTGRFPFILYNPEAAFQIAVGMHWLDARVKLIGNSAVVELRLLSTQPTIDEELLLALLYLGRLIDSQSRNEVLLSMECVRENRLSAMLFGRRRKMWFVSQNGFFVKLPFDEGIKLEIQRAQRGLGRLGLCGLLHEYAHDYAPMDFLKRQSPSSRLAEILGKRKLTQETVEDALRRANMLID